MLPIPLEPFPLEPAPFGALVLAVDEVLDVIGLAPLPLGPLAALPPDPLLEGECIGFRASGDRVSARVSARTSERASRLDSPRSDRAGRLSCQTSPRVSGRIDSGARGSYARDSGLASVRDSDFGSIRVERSALARSAGARGAVSPPSERAGGSARAGALVSDAFVLAFAASIASRREARGRGLGSPAESDFFTTSLTLVDDFAIHTLSIDLDHAEHP